jgi:hypothetical protein
VTLVYALPGFIRNSTPCNTNLYLNASRTDH